MGISTPKIAVVIPAYRVRNYILDVISRIGPEVAVIYVVDDCCPEHTGQFVMEHVTDTRVKVIFNDTNLGVGGATTAGYKEAIRDNADIVVKVDGDGQMNPSLIPDFVKLIIFGMADYTKGNRFYNTEDVRAMPAVRLSGNAVLSFLTKISTGYWNIFDPTNGFTAIHVNALKKLPLEKISRRYFFESDMLFRLSTIRAVVADVPMKAVYGDENSSMNILHIIYPFIKGHIKNFIKRIVYNYFIRDFSVASVELIFGPMLLGFGIIFGTVHWINSVLTGVASSSGTVMLAALPVIVGMQLILSALNYDIQNMPKQPISLFEN